MSRFLMASFVVLGFVAGIGGAQAQLAEDPATASIMQTPLEKSRAAIEDCRAQREAGHENRVGSARVGGRELPRRTNAQAGK